MNRFKYVLLFFISTSAFASGGDLGGGGTLPTAFKLSPQEKARLSIHKNPDIAFEAWVNTLDAKKQDELLLKVFDNLILPQIQE